jgi:hypothetical protein
MLPQKKLGEHKDQLGRLTEQLSTQQSLKHDGEHYWSEKDGRQDGPFCSVCWDVDKKLVRMRVYRTASGGRDYVCDYCGHHRGKSRG